MKAAVIGINGMGQTHLSAIQKGKVASEVAGCDVSEALCSKVAASMKIPTYRDVATLLKEFKPDEGSDGPAGVHTHARRVHDVWVHAVYEDSDCQVGSIVRIRLSGRNP